MIIIKIVIFKNIYKNNKIYCKYEKTVVKIENPLIFL
jgi:hypothetical protein